MAHNKHVENKAFYHRYILRQLTHEPTYIVVVVKHHDHSS
jgi:hypothetical protein